MSNYSTTYDPPGLCNYMLQWFWNGGSNFNTCLKNVQTGAWYNLYFYFTKEVDGKGGDGDDGYCCIVDDGSSCRCDEMKQQIVDTVLWQRITSCFHRITGFVNIAWNNMTVTTFLMLKRFRELLSSSSRIPAKEA